MITEIHIEGVASYKHAAILSTDKKINLIFGLNGTGKSIMSNFLYEPENQDFSQCKMVSEQSDSIMVYNQRFIKDNFFVSDDLKGIFSLSKENKAVEQKITEATAALEELRRRLKAEQSEKQEVKQEFEKQEQQAVEQVWKIKTESDGDRLLAYCLKGLKGDKKKLFSYLKDIPKPANEPDGDIKALQSRANRLKDAAAEKQHLLPLLDFAAQDVESHPIHGEPIVGSDDSEIACLIDELGNSDWVRQGLQYIPKDIDENGQRCPFCQEDTITSKFIKSIQSYFDDAYQRKIETIDKLRKKYIMGRDNLTKCSDYTQHPQVAETEKGREISRKYQAISGVLDGNLKAIEQKWQKPESIQKLTGSAPALSSFNDEVRIVNDSIQSYNEQLENRNKALKEIKKEFWSRMRWQYDQTILRYKQDLSSMQSRVEQLDKEIRKIESDIVAKERKIAVAQKETVNVDEAVRAINSRLLEFGMDDFRIIKYSDSRYRIVRDGDSEDVFHTLSEGEKMMISFLYFCELCKGRLSADDPHAKRIVVIDDPISSLSHVFIFNVGQLIRSVFFASNQASQVFVLTHSLYFFYELSDSKHERRKENQKLFRIFKNASGSDIREMGYEEIQNDYQAYWSVVNDPNQPAALIANCMRNIIEYFFNFVRRKNLNNVFQMPELQDVRFQAFCRYINRESHSLGQNIIDMKEFDYEVFKDGLKLIFEKTGYAKHFEEMSQTNKNGKN